MTRETSQDRIVVVAAATRHGSTAEVATRIETTLRGHVPPSWTVRMGDLSNVRDLDDADALVLGSAVYLGRWLRPAVKALHHVEGFSQLDVWLFSTGPVDGQSEQDLLGLTADDVVASGRAHEHRVFHAREHRVFGGRLDPARLSRSERVLVHMTGASSSDRRDWSEIEAWAASIAHQLTSEMSTDDAHA